MVNETEFFFFFFFGPVDCHECSRGWGDGGARDCERDPQKDVASRSNLSVCPGFEHISKLIYYIFVI